MSNIFNIKIILHRKHVIWVISNYYCIYITYISLYNLPTKKETGGGKLIYLFNKKIFNLKGIQRYKKKKHELKHMNEEIDTVSKSKYLET